MPGYVSVVRGIPGSGKTWLCQQLAKLGPKVRCVDTDDWLREGKTFAALVKLAKQTKRDPAAGLLVIVGVTLNATEHASKGLGFFIALNKLELETAYRRVLARELDKVVKQADALKKTFAESSVKDISNHMFDPRRHGLSFPLPLEFYEYKSMYVGASVFERKRGFTIASQKSILDVLKKVAGGL
jgi:adenylate kinase family enzyme